MNGGRVYTVEAAILPLFCWLAKRQDCRFYAIKFANESQRLGNCPERSDESHELLRKIESKIRIKNKSGENH